MQTENFSHKSHTNIISFTNTAIKPAHIPVLTHAQSENLTGTLKTQNGVHLHLKIDLCSI